MPAAIKQQRTQFSVIASKAKQSGKKGFPLQSLTLAALTAALLLLSLPVRASHQKADEITYIHLGGYTYRATLTSYTFTGTATDRP
ncbi:MAG: hypothetical protein LBC49_01860, partial [Bacteroidales bacterium]|nr:hypothetical protein [Bacteroidales bacterium]